MKRKEYPSQEFLSECLEYRDGKLYWTKRPRHHFACENSYRKFNVQFPGREAGYKTKYVTNGKEYFRWIIKINDKRYLRSCLVWIIFNDRIPDDKEVDHVNRNSLDDVIDNLRIGSKQQNICNRSCRKRKLPRGVHYIKDLDKYVARLGYNKKTIYLGYYDNIEEAEKAYKDGAIKYYGEFACNSVA